MKHILLIFFLLTTFLNAAILDDWYIFKAQKAAHNKEYSKALAYYQKIENKTDTMFYNMGNLSYRLKKYEQAIKFYNKINTIELQHHKYHNLADCYIELFDLEKAIQMNTKALQYKNDPKTRYNLELSRMIFEENLNKKHKIDNRDLKLRAGKSVEVEIANFFDDTKDPFDDENFTAAKANKNLPSTLGITASSDSKDALIAIQKSIDQNRSNDLKLIKYLEQKWDTKMKKNIPLHTLIIPLEKGTINDAKKPW